MMQQGESVYEETYLNVYESERDTRTQQSSQPKEKPASVTKAPESQPAIYYKKLWIFGACIFGIAIIVLLGVLLRKQMVIANECLLSQTSRKTKPSESCFELRQRGVYQTGIHQVLLPGESVPIEVFCDMETDGGGWSLVASIHENDINAKCSTDDRWSAYVPNAKTYKGKTSWENEMNFGEVRRSLLDDYKSSAYNRMQASDVMIWKAPLSLSITMAKDQSSLRYRTTNNFLRRYGGNLKTLFNRDFPLAPKVAGSEYLGRILKATIRRFSSIKYRVDQWYSYRVQEGQTSILHDNMHESSSNLVSFFSDHSSSGYVRYGREYRNMAHSDTFAVSGTLAPFTFLAAIFNDVKQTESFAIRVRSYRSSSKNIVSKFENTSTSGNFSLHYHAVQLYDSDETLETECRLYFYISNEKEWKSILPSQFFNSSERLSSRRREFEFKISGSPSRVLFGYMLLSKKTGKRYNSTELEDVAASILKSVSFYPNIMDAWTEVSTLSVPITFDRGNESTIMESVPANMRTLVQAGYIQFRAPNYGGFSNALCPGVSTSTTSPEYVCVGGMSSTLSDYGTCGDFAGWGGAFKRYYETEIGGYAHSPIDISSAYLIFYR